jgi:hypothetical protein
MHELDNPRRFKARMQSKPFAISKYEHVKLLVPTKERAGKKPVPRKGRVNRTRKTGGGGGDNDDVAAEIDRNENAASEDDDSTEDDEGASKVGTTGRIWRTRRRRDGKVSELGLLPPRSYFFLHISFCFRCA